MEGTGGVMGEATMNGGAIDQALQQFIDDAIALLRRAPTPRARHHLSRMVNGILSLVEQSGPKKRPGGAPKLTVDTVREARRLRRCEKLSYNELGRRFGVTAVVIRKAVIGETWSHVDDDETEHAA